MHKKGARADALISSSTLFIDVNGLAQNGHGSYQPKARAIESQCYRNFFS